MLSQSRVAIFISLVAMAMASSATAPAGCNYANMSGTLSTADGTCVANSTVSCSSSNVLVLKGYQSACSGDPVISQYIGQNNVSNHTVVKSFECSKADCKMLWTLCGSNGRSSGPTSTLLPGVCMGGTRVGCQANNEVIFLFYQDNGCSGMPRSYSIRKQNTCGGDRSMNISACTGSALAIPSGNFFKLSFYGSSSCSGTPTSSQYNIVNSTCSSRGTKDFCHGANGAHVSYEKADCTGKMALYRLTLADRCSKFGGGSIFAKLETCSGSAAPAKSFGGEVLIEKSYSGTTCQGQEIQTTERALGLCRELSASSSAMITCNATHATEVNYSAKKDCTGTSTTKYHELKKCTNDTADSSMIAECGSPLPLPTTGGATRLQMAGVVGMMVVGVLLGSA